MTYYYLKQKVSLGDIIDFKELKVEVTDNLIRSNPDLFVVEAELLPEYWECIDDGMRKEFTLGKIYKIQDKTYLEEWRNFIDDVGERNGFSPGNHRHFKPSTKEAAEDWLAKNKPKDLQYYEDLLWDDNLSSGSVDNLIKHSDMYVCLKLTNPKLYWLKVLELIQQDLDDGWKPDWACSGHPKFRISCRYVDTTYKVTNNYEFVEGFVYFKTSQSADKAIKLMGDKLDIIFK